MNPSRKTQQNSLAGQDFRTGMWRGLWLAVGIAALFIYFASMTGWLVISINHLPQLVEVWYWTHDNLRSSLIPFAVVIVCFVATIAQLRHVLAEPNPSYSVLYRLDKRSDVFIGLFFGIGVIWTAIGMRSALVGALGGLDAESAARLGAFGVLQAMVDEGILLALSTTIVGGVGGYLMRLVKMITVGAGLDEYYTGLNQTAANDVIQRLRAIENAVVALGTGATIPIQHIRDESRTP